MNNSNLNPTVDAMVSPVVTAKPVRGREMITKTVPTDVFESMRLMTAKKTSKGESLKQEIEKPREGNAELYHEGYVDGKRYLVPDSNLEAMKDIVNFKMRPRKSIRYKHQTSYELSDYDHFRKKLGTLIDKLDQIPDDKDIAEEEEIISEEESIDASDNEEDQAEEEPEDQRQKKDHAEGESEEGEEEEEKFGEGTEPEIESETESEEEHETKPEGATKSDHPNNNYTDNEEEPSIRTIEESLTDRETESTASSEVEHETKPKGDSKYSTDKYVDIEEGTETKNILGSKSGSDTDINDGYKALPRNFPSETRLSKAKRKSKLESDRSYIRLLISGHFINGRKPIYIIQEYNGDSLFKDQNLDIFTAEKNGDIDVLVAGKYYDSNILEETNGKPIALNIKPKKIIIDENTSKVYEDYFEDVFNMKTADILVKGQFIANEITKKVTPFIRFGVKRTTP